MSIPSGERDERRPPESADKRLVGGRRVSVRRRIGRAGATLLGLGLIVAAGAWAYYANVTAGRSTMDMTAQVSGTAAAFPVTLAPVERRAITGTVTYTGSVAPFAEEDIYPRVMGRIVEMPVYPGDAVRPGQVVARLDDVELASRVREATASAAAAEANLAQMEADVVAARHGVTQMDRELTMMSADVAAARDGITQMEKELAMVQAEAEYQEQLAAREERLFRTGAVSRQDVENARAMVASARAKVAAARAKVSQANAMVASAEARQDAARARAEQAKAMETSALRKRDAMAATAGMSRAQLRTAEVVRDYVTIVAPSAGYVVKRLVAPGVLVQPGMAILKIAQVDRVRLQANVGEKDVASVRVGAPVTVTTTDGRPPVAARVTAVFPFVDQGPRTSVVEAIVDNLGRRFLPGQYVVMRFVTGERAAALSVPRGAVVRMGGKARIWVVAEGRAESREVTTGIENPEGVEITGGLRGDERVVARGHEPLYAGARVSDAAEATSEPSATPARPGGSPGAVESGSAPEPAAPAKEAPHGTRH
jgi:RND family efflux transporter MFP subunit